MSDDLKLFQDDKDIMIECLTERVKDLTFMNFQQETQIENLKQYVSFFEKYSNQLSDFKHYLKWKEKINSNIENNIYINTETLNDDFRQAFIDKDIDKMMDIWERYRKIYVRDLLWMLEDKDVEIEELTQENDELKMNMGDDD